MLNEYLVKTQMHKNKNPPYKMTQIWGRTKSNFKVKLGDLVKFL